MNIIGKTIIEVRNLSEEELNSESWGGNCVCLVLNDGTLIYPSSDGEGNNHGFLFGKKGKKGFVLN